jgi:hypothetical protein
VFKTCFFDSCSAPLILPEFWTLFLDGLFCVCRAPSDLAISTRACPISRVPFVLLLLSSWHGFLWVRLPLCDCVSWKQSCSLNLNAQVSCCRWDLGGSDESMSDDLVRCATEGIPSTGGTQDYESDEETVESGVLARLVSVGTRADARSCWELVTV